MHFFEHVMDLMEKKKIIGRRWDSCIVDFQVQNTVSFVSKKFRYLEENWSALNVPLTNDEKIKIRVLWRLLSLVVVVTT